MDEEKAKLVREIEDAGLGPDKHLVIQNQQSIDDLVRALRLAAQLLEVRRDAGYRLIRHTDFVAYINKQQEE